jgi:outer membrane lipoprotein LolB
MMRWLLLLGLGLLNGCTSLHSPPVPFARPAQLESAPFAMNGRVSINSHGERHSAGLHWTHSAQSDEILLLTPLGQTAARIYRDDSHATLDEGDKHFQDIDAESLMEQVLGWHLPLKGLHHWVLAMEDPDSPAQVERDENGRFSELRQDRWQISYLRYADTSPDSLPSRLKLEYQDLQIQLLIDKWDWSPQ